MPDTAGVDRRSFIASLGSQAIRSLGTAVGLGETLQRQVLGQLRDDPPLTGEAAAPAPAVHPAPPIEPVPDLARLPAWVAGPGPSSWLDPAGQVVVLDQRALPDRDTVIVCRSVSEVAALLRGRGIDGGVAVTQASLQALVMAATRSGDAPAPMLAAVIEGAARTLASARPDVPLAGLWTRRAVRGLGPAPRPAEVAAQLRAAAAAFAEAVSREHALLAACAPGWWASVFPTRARLVVLGEVEPSRTGTAGTLGAVLRAAAAAGQAAELLVPLGDRTAEADRLAACAMPGPLLLPREIPDARIADWLHRGRVDAVVVGAAWGTRGGDMAAAAGSLATALLAAEAGVPVYAFVTGSMLVDGPPAGLQSFASRPDPDGPVPLDVVPSRLMAGVLTERGMYRPSELDTAFRAHGLSSG